jgi:hypothetical protein
MMIALLDVTTSALPDGAGSTTNPLTLVAVLVVAVLTMASVISYLFRYFSKRGDLERKSTAQERMQLFEERAKERQEWEVARVRLEMSAREIRAEYEAKHREIVERHAEMIRALYEDAREQENLARREYAANMEVVAEKARQAQEKVGEVLDKIYNRFVGTRRRD